MTKAEFSDEIRTLRKKTLSKSVDESKLDGRKVKATDAEFFETNKRITANIAGKSDFITIEQLQALKKSLTEDLWAYEYFIAGPDDKNTIDID